MPDEGHEGAVAPCINPYLQSHLPEIKAEICDQIVACEESLKQADVRLGQLLDYLTFEVDKLDARIDRLEWESRRDEPQIATLRDRKAHLAEFFERFPAGSASTSIRILRDLIDEVTAKLE